MASELMLKINTAAEMHSLGVRIGERLFPSAFIALCGDLGAGKTTLVKGIAEALGIEGILSPTFTIVRRHAGRLGLDHFDAYRIESEDELYAMGFEDHLASDSVIVMEWCENVPGALPENRLDITIEGSGDMPRTVCITARGSEYLGLLEEIAQC